MDKTTRKAIETATQRARTLLEDDFAAQLEGTFDVLRNGTIAPKAGAHLSARQVYQRDRIAAAVAHKRAAGMSAAEAVADYLRDAAFTTLNRFAALKMLEARKLVQECITKGELSAGYREFCGMAPGVATLPESSGYRLYIESLFDELSTGLKVLFNRRDFSSILWPRRACFQALMVTLNAPDLVEVWGEDETIGWLYQYYNGDDVSLMRKAANGGAPRNSRELAVRNQFFTPRYVVEFLTDNTLGRTWYEMTRGETVLRERCRYLIRRATEIFLEAGESAAESTTGRELNVAERLSQEELLRQPVYVPHRPIKDPREIRLLDPACGSMHFGLYAFDLYSIIYDEAWDIAQGSTEAQKSAKTFAPFVAFTTTFTDKATFLREVPRLIVECNIHGIDIDPRAAQIAGLSLWLRAQRAWHQAGVRPADRCRITRSNIVCAEPMPGEKELLREFVESAFPTSERPAFAFLMETIFDRMQLAGEAGSLLRIEEEIRTAVADAMRLWKQGPKYEQTSLFPVPIDRAPQEQLRLDLSGITDAQFWEQAEQRIHDALAAYAEQVEAGGGFQRRLFADDAAQGFAFIDLCTKHYDVVVMNPPFGDASLPSKSYIDETYGDTKGDVYKAFVECFNARLVPAGYLGIISSRTGFFLGQSEDWRTRVVLRLFRPIALADLGMGVLDAMVEVAAYVLRKLSTEEARDLTLSIVPVLQKVARDKQDRFSLPKWQAARDGLKRHQAVAELEHLEAHGFVRRSPGEFVRYTPLWKSVNQVSAPRDPVFPPLVCIRALSDAEKGGALVQGIQNRDDCRTFVTNPRDFASMPGRPFAYWASNRLRQVFREYQPFECDGRTAKAGLQTSDDLRFVRLKWETTPTAVNNQWFPFVKGGAFSPFYADVHLLVNWSAGGKEIYAFNRIPFGTGAAPIRNPSYYFRAGLTWPLRAKAFSPQVMPSGCIFSIRGYAAIAPRENLRCLLAMMSSLPFDYLFKLLLGRFGFPEFVVGVLQTLPFPELSREDSERLSALGEQAWHEKRSVDSVKSTSNAFAVPAVLTVDCHTLAECAAAWNALVRRREETVAAIQAEIDDLAFQLYVLDAADRAAMTATLVTEASADRQAVNDEEYEGDGAAADATELAADFLGYAFGTVFGRWDIRYAEGRRPAAELPDPFAPLPICPPGMLQGDDALPLSPEDGRQMRADGSYPIDVAWDGILVDDPEHSLDLELHIRGVLAVVCVDRAEAWEHEACELLGVTSLREWFRRPASFFADHLKRYSKSRRQAPIYWPLSTGSGSYTLWLYYHRFHKDTLYRCLELAKEKLRHESSRLARLAAEFGGSPDRQQRKELDAQEVFVAELGGFFEELSRLAPLWNPNLNDGVLINYAPFWRLIAFKPWQKVVKACWDELVAGDYDWAHLAMHLWPERVVPKCATDRSLAIAHGLEDQFWIEGENGKWQARATSVRPVEELVRERTSPAVKAALQSLLEAPSATGGRKSRKGKADA